MTTVAFSDDIVNASELRSKQKYWFEKASSKPLTVTYGSRKLAIMDREVVHKLFLQKHYLGLVMKYCEEVLRGVDSSTFPWISYLDKEEREEFHNELITNVVKANTTNNWSDVDELLEDWEATAEANQDKGFIKSLEAKVSKGDYIPIKR